MTSGAPSRIEVVSPALARLHQTASGAIRLGRDGQVHRLGLPAAPCFALEKPYSPDEPWRIAVDRAGARLDAPAPSGATDDAIASWAKGSRAIGGHGVLEALPQGEYLLVRSPREPRAVPRILLGNEMVPAEPNQRVILEGEPCYAAVIGADRDAPPDLDQPLVGVAVLNWTGETTMDALLFFPLAASARTGAHGDLVLAIPVEGALVLDAMGAFSAENEARSRERWRAERAERAARLLLGSG